VQATLVHTEIHTLISANHAEDHEFHVKSIEASAWFVRLYSFYRVVMSLYSVFTAFFLLTVDTSDTVSLQVDVRLLIKRAQTGDREAVGALYQAYSQSIYRYVIARVRSAEDAEDITSEVFISMVKGLASYQITEAPFAAWLYRIAASRVADHYRARQRQPISELTESLPDDLTLPEDQMLQKQSFDRLRAALGQLSEEHQTILILRFVDRKSHEEVAAILGKSMTAVKSAQHRALEHLTSILGGESKSRHYLRGIHE
jgi:RNA polymerase sigma-70 factor (ECF subfamily)